MVVNIKDVQRNWLGEGEMEGVWVRGEEEGMDGLGSWFGWMDGGKGCAGFTLALELHVDERLVMCHHHISCPAFEGPWLCFM